jgi:hypothetical protein
VKIALIAFGFLVGYFGHQAPRPALSDAELIETIADFEIVHIVAPPQLPWYGLTDFDVKRIWLVADVDLSQRRRTAIHEALHVALRLRGDAAYGDEDVITAMTETEYKRMFGK